MELSFLFLTEESDEESDTCHTDIGEDDVEKITTRVKWVAS